MRVSAKNYIDYVIFGVLGALAFAPFKIFILFFISFGWIFSKIYTEKFKKNLHRGAFLFFAFFYLANLYWIAVPLTIDLKLHGFLIPIAWIAIPSAYAIVLMPSIIITEKFKDPFRGAAIFSVIFSMIIYFFGHYCPGFPWVLPGYIWNVHEIFIQSLSIFGIYGQSFVTIFMAALWGASFVFYQQWDRHSTKISCCWFGFLFFLIFIFGFLRLENNPINFTEKSLRVVQGNFKKCERESSKFSLQKLQQYIMDSESDKKIDFIVWPEATVHYLYKSDDNELNEMLKLPLKDGTYLITGAPRSDIGGEKIYNSLIAIDNFGKNVAYYDKIHLVPFGEYIPFRRYLPFKNVTNSIGDFDKGTEKKILKIGDLKIAPMICYEAVFPLECIGNSLFNFFSKNIPDIDVMINLTNDAWFGSTTEPFQHFEIVRARAVEMGIPLVRVTNFGISAVFDSFGRVIGKISLDQKGVIDCLIPKRSNTQTLYAKYGDLFFFILLLAALFL